VRPPSHNDPDNFGIRCRFIWGNVPKNIVLKIPNGLILFTAISISYIVQSEVIAAIINSIIIKVLIRPIQITIVK